MLKIESLLYSPINMADFRAFCIDGKPTGPTTFMKDEHNRDIVGVFSWLHGWGVKGARFFHTSQNDPLQLFIALVQPGDETRPWFRRLHFTPPGILFHPEIPGIDKQLNLEGQFGTQDEFLSISELLAGLESDEDLDAEFAAQQQKVQAVIEQLEGDPVSIGRFLAALRSDAGTKSAEVFEELKFSLRD